MMGRDAGSKGSPRMKNEKRGGEPVFAPGWPTVARLARRFVPRICTTCPDSHVENCPSCFGWGITAEGAPISSHASYNGVAGWQKCPVCGGEPVVEGPGK